MKVQAKKSNKTSPFDGNMVKLYAS